jgi:D-tyrosyl-tRNA(Tyr) deacylase
MKALIQRVSESSVEVDGTTVAAIRRGLLVLLGIVKGDTENDVDYLVRKVVNLRIFYDEQGRMNLSVQDIKGELLVVSQFTLAADCRKGTRPSFDAAEEPSRAETLYNLFAERVKLAGIVTATGSFGAHMKIRLVNNGPVTFLIDSRR